MRRSGARGFVPKAELCRPRDRSADRVSEPIQILRADQEVARILAETDSEHALYRACSPPSASRSRGSSAPCGSCCPTPTCCGCLEVWCATGRVAGRAGVRGRHAQGAARRPTEGLPGRVLTSGEPAWIVEFATHDDFPRAQRAARQESARRPASRSGAPHGILGAIEFFSSERRDPDAELLETMASLGSQIGQLVERRRAEAPARARRTSASARSWRRRSTASSRSTTAGRVLEFNPAAEQTFGYRADEAIGREMAELIVPPSPARAPPRGLRALHRDRRRPRCSAGASRSPACAPTAASSRSS